MRALKLIPLLAIALLASACTKEYVTKEYITEETIIQGADMSLIDFNVKSSNWYEGDGYYEAILDVPDITKEVVNNGNVQVSRRYTEGGSTIWTPLPAMRVSMEVLDDGTEFYYTTFIDFEWSEGRVNIYVTTTDLYTGYNPGDMSFRVAIVM